MVTTKGLIHFEPPNITKKQFKQSNWKIVALAYLNDDTEDYYRWFINRRFGLKLNKTLRGSHCTFINDKNDLKVDYESIKNKYDNTYVDISFNPKDLRYANNSWFILCDSPELLDIRNELGLPKPFFDLHITVGRVDGIHTEQSEYIKRTLKNLNQYYI